jgi:hypothetical protein
MATSEMSFPSGLQWPCSSLRPAQLRRTAPRWKPSHCSRCSVSSGLPVGKENVRSSSSSSMSPRSACSWVLCNVVAPLWADEAPGSQIGGSIVAEPGSVISIVTSCEGTEPETP